MNSKEIEDSPKRNMTNQEMPLLLSPKVRLNGFTYFCFTVKRGAL